MTKNRLSMILCAGSLFAVGCGAEGMSTDDLETIEQELSSNAECDRISPDVRISEAFIPSFSSPSTYGHGSECSWAHLVNVSSYEDFFNTRNGNAIGIDVSKPTSKAECERHRIGVYAWQRHNNGVTQFEDATWKWGNWVEDGFCDESGCSSVGVCELPSVALTQELGLVSAGAGANYRFASSARRYRNPKDSRSGFSLRKLKYANHLQPRNK